MTVDDERASASRGTILVVDDEEYVRESVAEVLERRGFEVRQGKSGDQVLAERLVEGVDLVVTDLRMPGLSGRELVTALQESAPSLPVLVLTAHGTVSSAVDCLRAGAVDYLLKPVDPGELELAIERCVGVAARGRELSYLRGDRAAGERRLVGESPAWRQVLEMAGQVAASDSPVLLVGESGTGKEEVARYVQRMSDRSEEAFVAVNCAAIPGELFESELFGHRRGAFTGAVSDREGRFRVAHRGTLFLDEINSLRNSAQAKLLRVLQDGAFERVGDSRPTRVDVRLICAANVDLEAEVEAGRFRPDLFYRINVIPLVLPPLRERRGDVALLARAFLEEMAERVGRPAPSLDEEAVAALEAYGWPGNVRELRNVIERATLLASDGRIGASLLPFTIDDRDLARGAPATGVGDDLDLKESVRRAERDTLRTALERAGGVRRAAATLLGIDERNLAYYLRKHDLMDWSPAATGGEGDA